MPRRTESENIIRSTLSMTRSERESYVDSILQNPEKSGAFLDAMDALSGYLSLLRTGGGVHAHQRLGLDEPDAPEREPVNIDQYEIGERLGAGGFADVYAGNQLEPIVREVAIKILRSGRDDDEAATRFQAEQQALAQLDHPNIARVFDAGRTHEGQLFFAMEKIDGAPVTEYCQQRRLGLTQRLGLFRKICETVEFAHSRGIIHRDLKPSNVMVADLAGKPQVKVIDFGIAKAIRQPPLSSGPLTKKGEFLGTPEWMSPEQLGARSITIDRRSDVYALGVLLFEMLCDTGPFEGSTAEAKLVGVWRYATGDSELILPSGRAAHGSRHTREYQRHLKGDLDWITAKAMAIDPALRYQSVQALADDIGRYLGHEPVSAGPPTLSYRAGKFVRRNWFFLLTSSLALAALIGGLIQTTIERNRTSEALQTLTTVTNFQSQMLAGLDPYLFGRDLSQTLQDAKSNQDLNYTDIARSVIDTNILSKADLVLSEAFAEEPDVEARLRQSLAQVYLNLGLTQKAIGQLEQALNKVLELGGASPDWRVELLGQLADALDQDGQYDRALALGEDRLDLAASVFDEAHPAFLEALSDLANIHISFGNFEQAEQLQRQASEGFSRIYGPTDAAALSEKHRYATILHHQGRLDESLALREWILEARTKTTDRLDNDLIVSHIGLGSINHHLGNLPRAEHHLREAFVRRSESLGDGHPSTLSLYNRLAAVMLDQGRLAEAQRLIEQGLERFETTTEPDEPRHLLLRARLASVLTAQAKHEAAATALEAVYQDSTRLQGEDNPETVVYLFSLASAHLKAGRLETAQALFKAAEPHYLRIWGPGHPRYGILLTGMAEADAQSGRYNLALDRLKQTEGIFARNFGDKDHRLVADLLLRRARHLHLANRAQDSARAATRAAAMYRRLGLVEKAQEAGTLGRND